MSNIFVTLGNAIIANLGFRPILRGLASGEQDDDAITLGQFQNNGLSNLLMQNTELPTGKTATIPAGYNVIAYDTFTVNGTLTNNGTFHVVDWLV